MIAVMVVGLTMLLIYPMMLSRALKPQPLSVALYVDPSGVYADDAPLALREDIAQAYIRPSPEARTVRHTNYTGSIPYSYRLHLPSFPLSIELMLRGGRQLNVDPGGQAAAADILTALGFPVTMCEPDYKAKAGGRQWIITVLVVMLFLAALFGFSLYKSTGH
jgi:hypothetical protein